MVTRVQEADVVAREWRELEQALDARFDVDEVEAMSLVVVVRLALDR
jgi:hypothetical protein